MLDAIRKRYGEWTSRALLNVTEGNGRVEWPGHSVDSAAGPPANIAAWHEPVSIPPPL